MPAAATPTIKLAVEMSPSLAPRTAARSQPMCAVRCRSWWRMGLASGVGSCGAVGTGGAAGCRVGFQQCGGGVT